MTRSITDRGNARYRATAVMTVLFAALSFAAAVHADLYERAPDVMPGTIPEMRLPEYWVGRMESPDEVILDIEEIRARNERYQAWIRSPEPFKDVPEERVPIPYFYPGVVMYPPELSALAVDAVADTVRKRIGHEIDYLKSREWGNYYGIKHRQADIDNLIADMALDSLPGSVETENAITVRTTLQRNVPADFPAMSGAGDAGSHRWDRWSMGVIAIGRPVSVLHVSRTGEFVFVLSDLGYGWMPSVDVAFATADEIARFVDNPGFVVATGDRVPLYASKDCRYASSSFRMGDRLPLASRLNPRLVQIPERKVDGSLALATVWLATDADVSIGYLPYTRRNIVTQAFKLLDNPYDFTGELMGRQHETTYRDIFAVFGFELPRTDPLFTFYGSDDTVLKPEAGKERQYETILSHEPFVTLQSCGRHGQLYLGEYNGEPIVFDQHG